MTFSQVQRAMEYLRVHPEMHIYGCGRLAKLVKEPAVSRWTWQDARNRLELGATSRRNEDHPKVVYKKATPALAVGTVSNSTIVHIYAQEKRVKVLYHGVTREYTLKALDVKQTIAIYRHCGYRYTWLNDDVILLTKRGKRAAEGEAA